MTTDLTGRSRTQARRQRKALRWIVGFAAVAVLFDGYALLVYGAVVPTLLRDPGQIGALTPGQAGAVGSYALMGALVGALAAGAVGDRVGRRRMMLANLAWFSLGMGLTSVVTSVTAFGLLRFFTGIGAGAVMSTVGALIAEFSPPDRRNFYNAIVYSGVPGGGVMAALLAILTSDAIGWRGLFLIGALPLVLVLPVAALRLPESPRWLLARGHADKAHEVARQTGTSLPAPTVATAAPHDSQARERIGFAALATRRYARVTVLLGFMSFSAVALIYGLNTWLPEIMGRGGHGKAYAFAFLLALNGGAIIGGMIASRCADRFGPQRAIGTTFALAAVSLVLLTLAPPTAVMLGLVAVAGVGGSGTQVLILGFASNSYDTLARAAGLAWCDGFGRLGGILGPLAGGALVGAGVPSLYTFYLFAGVGLLGVLVTAFASRSDAAPTAAEQPVL
ncbi:MFS transporter [Streptomyces diastatochromogenes]|uniref:MFS transporter n=1 Tax=Streptomyces diastatochromogenes TaxID=42236 RepID=A0A233SY47_STRDA|nr:MFS transporter [Streptomyces diastatochromogenes]MCZ0991732.1 MFS transporter [Streptomyces diastatochromogenes]OXZ00555.1 MFS transporter [Streptomyces diastatochromogenes]